MYFFCTVLPGFSPRSVLVTLIASLRIASLRIASLRIASLRIASLRIASLRIASLRIASLRIASLRIASLRIASLRIASLRIASLLIASLLSSSAFSAPSSEPLDQGYEDVEPLRTSLRHGGVSLKRPTGFRDVYEVPGRPDLLMRVHGSLYAVFPRSQYERTSGGALSPVVPSGTVYYLGSPPGPERDAGFARDVDVMPLDSALSKAFGEDLNEAHPLDSRVDRSVDASVDPTAGARSVAALRRSSEVVVAGVSLTVWSSRSHRASRMRELVLRAVSRPGGSVSAGSAR